MQFIYDIVTEIESTVAVISRTTDTIVLTWDPLPGALVYTINYTDGVSSNVGQSFDSFVTISGLMHNTTYEFSVRGFGQPGEVNLGSASGTTGTRNVNVSTQSEQFTSFFTSLERKNIQAKISVRIFHFVICLKQFKLLVFQFKTTSVSDT